LIISIPETSCFSSLILGLSSFFKRRSRSSTQNSQFFSLATLNLSLGKLRQFIKETKLFFVVQQLFDFNLKGAEKGGMSLKKKLLFLF